MFFSDTRSPGAHDVHRDDQAPRELTCGASLKYTVQCSFALLAFRTRFARQRAQSRVRWYCSSRGGRERRAEFGGTVRVEEEAESQPHSAASSAQLTRYVTAPSEWCKHTVPR